MSSRSHVVHVGNFPLRSECEQAARVATRPAIIGTPSDHAAFSRRLLLCARLRPACRHALAATRLSGSADTHHIRSWHNDLGITILAYDLASTRRPRLLWARSKNKPRRSGAKSKGGNAPFQGHPQNIRVGCAYHGQLQLAPACGFWITVFETTFHRRTFCCRNGALVRAVER
jgi:hypothetical protein